MRTIVGLALMFTIGAGWTLPCNVECREPEVAATRHDRGCQGVRSFASSREAARTVKEPREGSALALPHAALARPAADLIRLRPRLDPLPRTRLFVMAEVLRI